MGLRRRGAQLLVWLATALALHAAAAAETPRERQGRAIQTFERGQAQFKAGRYDAAAGLFKEAFETWEDPAYLYNIGFSFEKAERWRLAILWYDRFLARYGTTPNAPEVKLRRDAAAASREAARATVMVVSHPSGARALALSEVEPGEVPPSCVTPCELRVDSGPVAIRVELGSARVERSKGLASHERWDLTVDLPGKVPRRVDRKPSHTASWIAWAAGGAALVTGVIFAIAAKTSFDDGKALVARAPLDERDYRHLGELRGDVRDQSLYADIGFGAALVGGAIGTFLWVTAEPDAAPEERASWR